MATMNIAIKKEAYDFLKSLKSNRSFSEVILGFKEEHAISHLFGVLKDKDWKAAEKEMQGLRDSFGRNLP